MCVWQQIPAHMDHMYMCGMYAGGNVYIVVLLLCLVESWWMEKDMICTQWAGRTVFVADDCCWDGTKENWMANRYLYDYGTVYLLCCTYIST